VRIAFFITHKTLGVEHAHASFKGISEQVDVHEKFDKLIVYNTHQDELSNLYIENLYRFYELDRFFKELEFFDYDPTTVKSLGADIDTIRKHVKENYSPDDLVLIMKSDTVPSAHFFSDIMSLPVNRDVYFVAPFVCAKSRISDREIHEYASRREFVRSDDVTFFVEDEFNSPDNDFNSRPGVNVTDPEIKFTSCYVITDFSCHYMTARLMDHIHIQYQTWGGAKFYNLRPWFISTSRSFVVHKFHGIQSENRDQDREGPVREWLAS